MINLEVASAPVELSVHPQDSADTLRKDYVQAVCSFAGLDSSVHELHSQSRRELHLPLHQVSAAEMAGSRQHVMSDVIFALCRGVPVALSSCQLMERNLSGPLWQRLFKTCSGVPHNSAKSTTSHDLFKQECLFGALFAALALVLQGDSRDYQQFCGHTQ